MAGTIDWSLYSERAVGRNSPSFADVVNRPLREVLTISGADPDASFVGFSLVGHTHDASAIVSGTLPTTRGGTGLSSPTAGGLLVAAGALAMTLLAPGASSQVVKSNGAAWASAAIVSADISDAASINTASVVVKRDGSGNFAAGTITANLTGNASTATALATGRTIWGQNFDGTANVSGALTGVSTVAASGVVTASGLTISAAIGKIIPGATSLSHRNSADNADNLLISDAGAITVRSTISGVTTLTAASVVAALTGNADTATKLATARTIAITGDLAYTSSAFDGSGNATAAGTLATVNANVGSFGGSTAIPVFTVNGKGLITATSTAVVIAPAGTLTGATLASNVLASSLTSVGVLASPHLTSAVIDSGGLTITAGTLAANGGLTASGLGVGAGTPANSLIATSGNLPGVSTSVFQLAGTVTSAASGSNTAGIIVAVQTQASAFTATAYRGVWIQNLSLGAGSAVTTQYGLVIDAITSGATNFAIQTNGGQHSFGGNLIWGTDNSFDIGASGASRARDLFLARNATIGGTTTHVGVVGIGGSSATAALSITLGVTASASAARSVNITNSLTAAANSDTLSGIRIAPTYSIGGFAGVVGIGLDIADITGASTNIALRTGAGLVQFGGAVGVNVLGRADSLLAIGGSLSASGGTARAVYAFSTLSAAANNDVLTSVRVDPNFGNAGAFTGLTTRALFLGSYTVPTNTTTAFYVDIGALTATGATTATALNIANVSGATSNFAIKTGTGVVSFGDALIWGTDNSFDIGLIGANRARDLFLARNFIGGGTISASGATGGITLRPGVTNNGCALDSPQVNLANLATLVISPNTNICTVTISANATGDLAIVALKGGANTVSVLASTGTWGTALGAANNYNVYYDAGSTSYKIENRSGGICGFTFTRMGNVPNI